MFWPGHRGAPLLGLVDREAVGTVAMSLPLLAINKRLTHLARVKLGFGVMYRGENWCNQLPPEHRLRGPRFQALSYAHSPKHKFRPEARALTPREAGEIAALFLDAQMRGDPTIFVTPEHFPIDGPTALVASNDVDLAHHTASTFRARQLSAPRKGDVFNAGRELYGAFAVPAKALTAKSIAWLVDAWREVDVSGYVIWAAGFSCSRKQFELMRSLALGLQEATGRPVCPGGLGDLWQGALRNGVAAAVHGPQKSFFNWPPPDLLREEGEDSDEEPPGWTVMTFHGPRLGSFPLDKKHEPLRRRAFIADPCECGAHPRSQQPQTKTEKLRHNVWWMMTLGREACADSSEQAIALLAARIDEARRNRTRLGGGSLPTGWDAAADFGTDAREDTRDV